MTDKDILSALHEEPISPCEECAAISIDCKNLCAQYKKCVKDNEKEEPVKNLEDAAAKAASAYRDRREACGLKEPICLNEIDAAYYEGMFAGAEWMANQGATKEGIVLDDGLGYIKFDDGTYIDLDPALQNTPAFNLRGGDKVIVQIKKKED